MELAMWTINIWLLCFVILKGIMEELIEELHQKGPMIICI